MEILDTPGLHPTERRDNPRRLAILRDSNGLLVVLNGFSGGSLTDELRRFREELLFADLEIVTNRLDKLKDLGKKTKPAKQREAEEAETALLQRVAACLERGEGAAAANLKPDEEKADPQLSAVDAEAGVDFRQHRRGPHWQAVAGGIAQGRADGRAGPRQAGNGARRALRTRIARRSCRI